MKIQLFHGDCFEVMRSLPDGSLDAIIADLPYALTDCDWDQKIDLRKLWVEFLRVVKRDGPIILTASQPFTTELIASQPRLFRFAYYWRKTYASNFLAVRTQPLRLIEEVLVFARSAKYTYNPQRVELAVPRKFRVAARSKMYGDRDGEAEQDRERALTTYTHASPVNVLEFANETGANFYMATQKPVALMEYLVKTFTNEGDLVLDSTMGSGTTGVACANLRRGFIGIEKVRAHFEIAKRRIYGLPTVEIEDSPYAVGARKTHFLRTARQEKAIQAAMKQAKKAKLKITKTLIAQMVGISRQQMTQRYSHLFVGQAVQSPATKKHGASVAAKVAAE